MYLQFVLHSEIVILPYYCRDDLGLIFFILSYEQIGGGALRTGRIWECRKRTRLFLHQVTHSTQSLRASGTTPRLQALRRDY